MFFHSILHVDVSCWSNAFNGLSNGLFKGGLTVQSEKQIDIKYSPPDFVLKSKRKTRVQ